MRSAHIFLLAGEPSGDMIGARLMQALSRAAGAGVRFSGVGGPRMAQAGLASLFPMQELSLIGFAEVLPHLPRLARRMRETVAAVARLRPDMVLTVDSPGFSLRLQRRLRGRDLLRVHYVAPQVWAWREDRARKLAGDLDHLLALLPFEPPFFERHGLACSFVGHPIIEEAGGRGDATAFRARFGIETEAPLLCLLPGSRRGEIVRHLPILCAAAEALAQHFAGLRAVLPTLPELAPLARDITRARALPVLVLEERSVRFDAYAASRLAIAASGTVSLELALAGLPFVTIYRTGPLTAWLARRVIRVPHVNLVNLILDRPAVPELLQEDCRPEPIAAAAARLMEDDRLRDEQAAALKDATAALDGDGAQPPSQRAAERVLAILKTASSRRTA